MAQDSRTVIDSWFEAWNAHDLDQAAQCLSEDVTLEQPEETGHSLRGRDAVRGYIAELYDAFPDARLDVTTVITQAEQAAAEYVFRGTQQGEYRGVQAQDNAVENPIVDVMDVRNGQIAAIRRYDRRPAKVAAPTETV